MRFKFEIFKWSMAVSNEIIGACLLYEFKLRTKTAEACRKICPAFGEGTIAERTGQKWFKNFLLEMKTLKMNQDLEDRPPSITRISSWQSSRAPVKRVRTLP